MSDIIDLETAVAQHLAALDIRDALRRQEECERQEQREARCLDAAKALSAHILTEESIEVDPLTTWVVREEKLNGKHLHNFELNTDDPGQVLYTAEDEFSGISLRDVDINAMPPRLKWTAWHKSENGYCFDTFIAAITFALTGRK